MLNLNKHTKKGNLNLNQHANLRTVHVCVCIWLCTTVVHNTTQFWSFPSWPTDIHRSSDAVYWRGGEAWVPK